MDAPKPGVVMSASDQGVSDISSGELGQALLTEDESSIHSSIEDGDCATPSRLSRRLTRLDGLGISVRLVVCFMGVHTAW